MPDDTSLIWKWYAQQRMQKSSLCIPMDMGMEFVRNMTCGELVEIIWESTKGQPLTGELRSFLYDELVVVASDKGETKYLTVEISFNAKEKHSRAAIRYAQLLEELSGITTIPVVASYRIDSAVQQAVGSGDVYWHYVPDHVLDPH